MIRRRCRIFRKEQRLLIKIVFENGLDAFAREPVDCQGTGAGIFKGNMP
jgi:hypothetical protein